jgi:hypothetical protein
VEEVEERRLGMKCNGVEREASVEVSVKMMMTFVFGL